MGSLKIMPCSSRQPATGLPKAGQILNSTQQGQHSVSHSILWLVSVRDGSFYFPASGELGFGGSQALLHRGRQSTVAAVSQPVLCLVAFFLWVRQNLLQHMQCHLVCRTPSWEGNLQP